MNKNIAICCLIKDTPEYLLKAFVQHHRNIGIQDIYFMVDNGSKNVEFVKDEDIHYLSIDNALEQKEKYNEKFLNHLYRDCKQLIAYNWFYEIYKNKYDWIVFIDDDEHLCIDLDILENYKDYSSLYIPWIIYINKRMYKEDNLDNFE